MSPLSMSCLLALLLSASAGAQSPDPVVDDPPATAPSRLPLTTTAADGLYVEFGRGVRLTSDDSAFSLTMRGRVQTRATARSTAGSDLPPDIFFQVRRARLVLLGDLVDQHLQMYVQLGLGASDLEADAPVPLRDGVVSWNRYRDGSVRVGQMKVPFSRQRMVSSSALQLVDRSHVTAELNLDRDVGVQVYSNDLFGLNGVLAYQAGIYGGEGRNRTGQGTGLLYVGRVQVQPLGGFDDTLIEADLTRSRQPRLSIGAAGGVNLDTRRARSTHGAHLPEGYDMRHAALDLMFKWSGWSVQVEANHRDTSRVDPAAAVDGPVPRDGWGWMAQSGYVFANGYEIAGRYAELVPAADSERPLPDERQATACLGRYMSRHDLKIQADYGLTFLDGLEDPGHEGRVQLQFFF